LLGIEDGDILCIIDGMLVGLFEEKEVGPSLVSMVGFELILLDGGLLFLIFVFVGDGRNDGLLGLNERLILGVCEGFIDGFKDST